ncbi:MAG: gluconate 2-dehydrogenase subunit 3 family protein [Gemmatimonadota bacterium]
MDLSRREALHRLTLLVGGALSAPTLGALLSGCRVEPSAPDWVPRVLTPDELELLELLVERIIPTTDTPGARDAGVPAFIDALLDTWVDVAGRERFLSGLAAVDQGSAATDGVAFRRATPERQDALLARLDEEAARAREEDVDPLPFFATLKEWTLVGYYTSEVGATQELQWLAAPGRYDGDLPLEEVGPTWA